MTAASMATPKNLVMALAGKPGLLPAADPGRVCPPHARPRHSRRVESELADVLQYLIRLADVLDIDPAEAVRKKVGLNETRFPLA